MSTLLSMSIAKGSFHEESAHGTISPQLTFESVESDVANTDQEGGASSSNPTNTSAVQADEDEHDEPDHGQRTSSSPSQPSRPLGRSNSMPIGIEVLEPYSRLDLSDSNALISSVNKNHNRRTLSKKPSLLSSRRISRRPSMHDTHDEEPLKRGEFLYYLYSFAILGTSIRVFMGRLFGHDCDQPGEINDWLSPLSEQICVTNGGTTLQTGGALFIDLPANIFGCFIMGLVSSLHPEGGRRGSKLPWLRRDHPLQKHEGIHHAIKVGLCGSLTTFSSWNSQMVLMMDGTDTELGPQVIPALFGYMVGMACAVWGFIVGGRAHEWLFDWSNGIKAQAIKVNAGPSYLRERDDDDADEEQPPTSWDTDDSHPRDAPRSSSGKNKKKGSEMSRRWRFPSRPKKEDRPPRTGSPKATILMHKVIPFVLAIGLLVGYGIGFGVYDMQFYREIFACSILTPIGVHLRWKLASLNGRGLGESQKYEWVPFGTLTGNMLAVVISIIFQALYMKYSHNAGFDHPIVLALVVGMKTGLAGSLSTVSSFVKESVNLATIHPTHAKAYIYSTGTIVSAMLLGLTIYSPWMRYG